MPDVELVSDNGKAVELAKDGGPPEGEQGSADPQGQFGRLFADFDIWTASSVDQPSERKLGDMLDRDGKAQALEQVLTLPLRWAPWSIEAASDDSGEAELVTEALKTPPHQGGMSTPMDHVIAQMTSAVVLRRAFFEKVFRVDEQTGRVVFDKLAFRPADSCTLRRDPKTAAFRGFRQRVSREGDFTTVDIGPEKALVYVHDQARAPMRGRSALQTAYRAYEAKQKVRFLWFAFLERHATPWAAAKDGQNDPDGADALARKVAGLKGGGVVGLRSDQSIELMEPQHGGDAFKDCMDWLSAEQSVSVLASFTDLAQQGSGKGSYALSADQSDFFLRSRGAVLGEMAAAITSFAITDLIRWNRGPAGRCPSFKFGELQPQAAEEARKLFEALASTNTPNPRLPAEFLDLLTVKVADHLGLDVDQVRKALQARTDREGTPAGELAAGIDAAARLVAEAGVTRERAEA